MTDWIQGTTTGTIANDDGKYTLQLPKPGVYTLVISAMGFETAHKRIVAKDNKTMVLNIALEQSQMNTKRGYGYRKS